jgi:hypothetical protein
VVRLDSNPAYRGVLFGPPQYNGTTLHEDNFANQAPNWGSEVYSTQTKDGTVLAFIRNEDSPTAWMTRSLVSPAIQSSFDLCCFDRIILIGNRGSVRMRRQALGGQSPGHLSSHVPLPPSPRNMEMAKA